MRLFDRSPSIPFAWPANDSGPRSPRSTPERATVSTIGASAARRDSTPLPKAHGRGLLCRRRPCAARRVRLKARQAHLRASYDTLAHPPPMPQQQSRSSTFPKRYQRAASQAVPTRATMDELRRHGFCLASRRDEQGEAILLVDTLPLAGWGARRQRATLRRLPELSRGEARRAASNRQHATKQQRLMPQAVASVGRTPSSGARLRRLPRPRPLQLVVRRPLATFLDVEYPDPCRCGWRQAPRSQLCPRHRARLATGWGSRRSNADLLHEEAGKPSAVRWRTSSLRFTQPAQRAALEPPDGRRTPAWTAPRLA